MFCQHCGNQVNDQAIVCTKCGCEPKSDNSTKFNKLEKSRTTYVLLGIFLGSLGVHNFYAKRTGCAVAQLILGLTLFGMIVTGPWSIIEACVVTTDGQGRTLA